MFDEDNITIITSVPSETNFAIAVNIDNFMYLKKKSAVNIGMWANSSDKFE